MIRARNSTASDSPSCNMVASFNQLVRRYSHLSRLCPGNPGLDGSAYTRLTCALRRFRHNEEHDKRFLVAGLSGVLESVAGGEEFPASFGRRTDLSAEGRESFSGFKTLPVFPGGGA